MLTGSRRSDSSTVDRYLQTYERFFAFSEIYGLQMIGRRSSEVKGCWIEPNGHMRTEHDACGYAMDKSRRPRDTPT